MSLIKRVQNAYLFPNGMVAAFDIDGKQIPELQDAYSIELHKKILLESTDNCVFHGFGILPNGFLNNVFDIHHFRDKNMSWEEIKSLQV